MRLITFFISNSKANKILIAMEPQDDGYHEQTDRQIQNVANELGLGGFVAARFSQPADASGGPPESASALELARLERRNENPGKRQRWPDA